MLDQTDQTINLVKSISLSTYFPESYKLLTEQHKTLFGQKLSIDQNEFKYYNSKIKNLDLNLFIIHDKNPNAFTIPGLGDIDLLKKDPIQYQSVGLEYLSQNPLTASVENGKIYFNTKVKVLVFLTSGLFKRVTNVDDRLAILLHELGHWVYIKNLLSSSIYYSLISLVNAGTSLSFLASGIYDSKALLLLLFILRTCLVSTVSIKNRQNEYDADSFAKSVGYGPQLQNSLSLLAYNKQIADVNLSDKTSFLNDLFDIFSMIFNTHSHPPTHKRIQVLQENIDMIDGLVSLLSPIDRIIKNNNGTICNFI